VTRNRSWTLGLAVLALWGCTDSGRDVPPDLRRFHYPTGVAADPAGDFVYVVSTNFDSRYSGGTVLPVDVRGNAVVSDGGVEVGSFGGDVAVASRDPFAVALGVDGPGLRPLYVGSLLDGTLLVFQRDDAGTPSFAAGIGLRPGVHTLVEWPLPGGDRLVFASNRMFNEIHVVHVSLDLAGKVDLKVLDSVLVSNIDASGDYFRGLARSVDGPVMYAAFRSPPSLAVFDVEPAGRPVLRGLVPLHGAPSSVAVYVPAGKAGQEMVYVTNFSDDTVYCVDPRSMAVVDRVVVGDGPYGIAIAGTRAYVTDFEEHALSVLELDQASPDWNREIARLK